MVMKLKYLIILFLSCLISLLGGCTAQQPKLPSDIWLEIQEVQKPKIENIQDISRAYIDLFATYKHNLYLLEYLKSNITQN